MSARGFAPVFLVILAAFVLAVGVFVYTPLKSLRKNSADTFSSQKLGGEGQALYGICEESGTTKLATFPLDPKDIEVIVPMGRVQDSHVTPTDHQYIIPKGTSGGSIVTDEPEKYKIRAPFDGYIVNIELFKEPVESAYRKDPYSNNYLVVFEYSCDYFVRLIHIDTLSQEINSSFKFDNPNSQHPNAHPRIPVKEGQVIGTVGPHSFDFQIMDTTKPDKSFISPKNVDLWTPPTVDTFRYVSDSLKADLLPRNLRTREPLGGKAGYDKDGTLLGNWFRVGRDPNKRDEYWTQNLSIVYDHIDESQVRVSLGDFSGYPKAFGVKGNGPDPKDITKSTDLVKYELNAFDYFDSLGNKWDTVHFVPNLTAKNEETILGVVLLQLVEDRKLEVEVFPGKIASQVSGFTSQAKMYER